MNTNTEYRPSEYWEGLLNREFDLRGVGYPNLSIEFNRLMYRAMADSVERGLRRVGLTQDYFRKASMLDVGSGTGFWIDFWLSKGATQIMGVDLASESVSHLTHTYPSLKFEQRDIADPIGDSQVGTFDLISAMSILHHIPAQERWEQALVNLGRMLRPGGYIIVMDPMLRYEWRGKPVGQVITGRPRKISEHLSALKRTGVTPRAVVSTLALLANPIDTRTKLEFLVIDRWWRLFDRVASREHLMRSSSWLIYPLDRALTRLNYMPASKIVIGRKE